MTENVIEYLSKLPDATIPAWSGLFISLILAVEKIWEHWRDRFKIEVGHSLVSDASIGNTIAVRNLSPYPVILTYWEIFYANRFFSSLQKQNAASPDFDQPDSQIEEKSTLNLHFQDSDHFQWSQDHLNGRSIYIDLHFAGHGRIRKRIYPR